MENAHSFTRTRRRRWWQSALLSLLGVAVVFVLGAAAMVAVAYTYPGFLGIGRIQPDQAAKEVTALIAEVQTLIDLPSDETPTIATVTDREKLQQESFFRNAQNGDKVLMYTRAQKVILYRPAEKRIIEVGAINVREPAATAMPDASPSPEPDEALTAE